MLKLNQLLGGNAPASGIEIKDWSGFLCGFKDKLGKWKAETEKGKDKGADKKTNVNATVVRLASPLEKAVLGDLRNAVYTIN